MTDDRDPISVDEVRQAVRDLAASIGQDAGKVAVDLRDALANVAQNALSAVQGVRASLVPPKLNRAQRRAREHAKRKPGAPRRG